MSKLGSPVLGILVGGLSSRMNGFPKGLLEAPNPRGSGRQTLVEAMAQTFLAAAPDGEVVLLGTSPDYRVLPYAQLEDDPPKSGPIGGLGPLLRHCANQESIALMTACDLPYLTTAMFQRLLRAPDSIAVAFKRDGQVEPLPSRFDPVRVLPVLKDRLANQMHSVKGLLETCGASLLDVTAEDAQRMQDWDSPEDMKKGVAQ